MRRPGASTAASRLPWMSPACSVVPAAMRPCPATPVRTTDVNLVLVFRLVSDVSAIQTFRPGATCHRDGAIPSVQWQ